MVQSLVLRITRSRQADNPLAARLDGPEEYQVLHADETIDTFTLDWPALRGPLAALLSTSSSPDERLRVGLTLRDALRDAGWDRVEQQLQAGLSGQGRVQLTFVFNAAELYALPWEALPLGGAMGPALAQAGEGRLSLRYRWPGARSALSGSSMQPEPALLVWSDAGGPVPHAEVSQALQGSFPQLRVLERPNLASLTQTLSQARDQGAPFRSLILLCHGVKASGQVALALGVSEADQCLPAALSSALRPLLGDLSRLLLLACRGGDAQGWTPGLGGFAQLLHGAGAQTVFASRADLSQRGAVELCGALGRGLREGLPDAEALARARASLSSLHDQLSVQLYQHDATTRPSTQRAPVAPPHVPRPDAQASLRNALLDSEGPRRVSLVGMPGVGKTHLAEFFVAETTRAFPGGVERLLLSAGQDPQGLALALAERRGVELQGPGLMLRLEQQLRSTETLLLVDGVDDQARAETLVGLAAQLPGVPVLACGRLRGLGLGWLEIELRPWTAEQGLEQLRLDLEGSSTAVSEADRLRLIQTLGGLPLAIRVAASHLRQGRTVDGFLRRLREQGLSLESVGAGENLSLASVFRASLNSMHEQNPAEAERLYVPALKALAWAPPQGFGEPLARAITGLGESDLEQLLFEATRLSLLEPLPLALRNDPAWRLHPLLGEWLRAQSSPNWVPLLTWWCAQVIPIPEETRSERWGQAWAELAGLEYTLRTLPAALLGPLLDGGRDFCEQRGPKALWLQAAQRALPQLEDKAPALRLIALLAPAMGDPQAGVQAAQALRALPGLSDAARADTLGLEARARTLLGELDTALSLLQQELALQSPQSPTQVLVTLEMGRVRLRKGELPQATSLMRSALSMAEARGDLRAQAIILGDLSQVLLEQGQAGEALSVAERGLRMLADLDDLQGLASAQRNLAVQLERRGQPREALALLERAMEQLERLGEKAALPVLRLDMARQLVTLGSVDRALVLLRQAIEELRASGDRQPRATAQQLLARLLAAQGQLDEAQRLLADAAELRRACGDRGGLASVQIELAAIRGGLGANQEAQALLRSAMDTLETLGQRAERARAQLELALLQLSGGAPAEAERGLREVLSTAQQVDDRRLALGALPHLAQLLLGRGDLIESERLARQALSLAEAQQDQRARARALVSLARTLRFRGANADSLSLYREAMEGMRAQQDLQAFAVTQGELGLALAQTGDADAALRALNEAARILQDLGEQRERAVVMGHIARVHAARGDARAALTLLSEELSVSERLGDRSERARTLAEVARILMQKGELDDAAQLLQEARATHEALGDRVQLALVGHELARIHSARGQYAEAMLGLSTALREYQTLNNPTGQASALLDLGRILTSQGRMNEAEGPLREAHRLLTQLGDLRGATMAQSELAAVFLSRGQLDEALRLRQDTLQQYTAMADQLGQATALGEIARVLIAKGARPEAVPLLQESLRLFEVMGDRLSRAITLWELGSLYQALQDLPACERTLEAAWAEALALRVPMLIGNVGSVLGQLRQLRKDTAGAIVILQQAHAAWIQAQQPQNAALVEQILRSYQATPSA